MANNKPIRKAIATSALAVTMCASMLAGTTYAWFTDSTASGTNIIQSGYLDLEVYHKLDTELIQIDEVTDLFSNVEGQPILWEPGASASETFVIKNEGNLALKYQFNLNVTEYGDLSLLDVLSVCVNGGEAVPLSSFVHEGYLLAEDEEEITVKIQWLPGENDNLYNIAGGLHLDVSINVVATQYTYEYDGTGNQYDADADFVTKVYTAADLIAALKRSGTIVMMNDIELDLQLVVGKSHTETIDGEKTVVVDNAYNIVLDMNGHTLSLADGAPSSCDPMIDLRQGSSLTIDGDGYFDLGANPGFSFVEPRGDLTINSGTFTIDTGMNSYGSFFVGINGGKGRLIINGGYFDGGYYVEGDCFNNCRNLLNGSWGQYIRVYGGTFVGQNPAWGDEGMAYLCTECAHETTYCQGLFLEGQSRTDTTLPDGYSIIEGTTDDGRSTYTVYYTKP